MANQIRKRWEPYVEDVDIEYKYKYFFINGNLHRRLYVNRAADTVEAYDYVEQKRKMYSWSSVKKTAEKAFTLKEAGQFLNRSYLSVRSRALNGEVGELQAMHSIRDGKNGRLHAYMLSETQILKLHTIYANSHFGRPREDGRIVPYQGRPMPNKDELRHMMQTGEMLFKRDKDGNFVPVWLAERNL